MSICCQCIHRKKNVIYFGNSYLQPRYYCEKNPQKDLRKNYNNCNDFEEGVRMTYYDTVEFNDCLNIWFSDIISEDKAYELAQIIKKELEEVHE